MKKVNITFLISMLFSVALCGCTLMNNMPKNMPEDFSVVFSYGANQANHKNILDTKNGKLNKDLILDGVATSDIKLSEEKRNEIYELLQNIGVNNYPVEYQPPYKDNPEPGMDVFVIPNTEYELEIFYSGTTYKIHWNDNNNSEVKKAVLLRESFKKIISIIEGTEEYKNLPEPKGGYA